MTRVARPPKRLAVEVSEDAPALEPQLCKTQASDELPGDGGRIRIELPAGIRIRATPPVDATALAHVLRALGRR